MEWTSDNGKWIVKELKVDSKASVVTVVDTVNKKSDRVWIEHIEQGQRLLIGTLAEESFDHFITNLNLPKYLKIKILEMIHSEQ